MVGWAAGRAWPFPWLARPVRKGDLVLTVATTGQVRSDAVSSLKGEANGSVEEVLVRPGSRVKKGDPIVRLDPRPFDLAVREAEANLAEAQIRYQGSLASDSILLGPGQEADRLKNALALSGVPAQQVRLEKAKLERERATITAPFDGMVDGVAIAVGERLSPGQDVATIVDVTHLRVEAQVLEHDLPYVRIGGEALITTPATRPSGSRTDRRDAAAGGQHHPGRPSGGPRHRRVRLRCARACTPTSGSRPPGSRTGSSSPLAR